MRETYAMGPDHPRFLDKLAKLRKFVKDKRAKRQRIIKSQERSNGNTNIKNHFLSSTSATPTSTSSPSGESSSPKALPKAVPVSSSTTSPTSSSQGRPPATVSSNVITSADDQSLALVYINPNNRNANTSTSLVQAIPVAIAHFRNAHNILGWGPNLASNANFSSNGIGSTSTSEGNANAQMGPSRPSLRPALSTRTHKWTFVFLSIVVSASACNLVLFSLFLHLRRR
ncbi:unnamed protein product [Amoebophrya sp. A25]|nr:unnamed protein product [Amoebophrya sp. A25]|eukprot:GSA25T00010238001.1